MGKRLAAAWWSVEIPEAWVFRQDPECVTVLPPNDISALQFSAARSPQTVTDGDLQDFASDHLSAGAKTREVRAGDFDGFALSFRDDTHYWRQWFLKAKNTALFVTYNCPIEFKGREDASVDSVLGELRVNESAP